MKPINDQNIDEIMFQLIEGEITGIDREMLLEAIQADPAYASLWSVWQNTVLKPEAESPSMDLSKLKKRGGFIVQFNIRYAAAAVLILSLGLSLYMVLRPEKEIYTADKIKPVISAPASKMPVIAKDSLLENKFVRDTFVPFREKVKHIADAPETDNRQFDSELFVEDKIARNEFIKPAINEISTSDTGNIIQSALKPVMAEQNLIVTVETESYSKTAKNTDIKNRGFFSRILGTSKIRIENDSNTFSNKKIILQNNKYEIIAGF